ncbi:GAF domain-containing protein [Pseudohoeflea suaedae]|uniref:GAF domain-containing protein n=1 Tax=Pseudohoeflea suaedae TaxID=877384 RepID=A0A4R5PKZ1_9HYPH|nr:histidine kinase dimerization/phosphoacceptor domain -containing protein [Pseudohoeflea suaedae]TDH37583.1 GAF domain-containing protein [Pseudohoeflea suaedae]
MKADLHPREDERLERLADYDILDTLQESEFDNLVALASKITGAPVSLVSLVDRDRQWFKAKTGFPDSETGLENSICAHGMGMDGIFEISDTTKDARTADMDIVTAAESPVRFYAGAPLVSDDGLPLGMLCVLDHKPRELDEDQKFALRVLGDQVMAQLELRRRLKTEITIRRELEESLAERDLLAREVDHRVKNSLAMVTSFITMQMRREASPEAKKVLEAAAARINAISALHQELYLASEHGQVSLPQLAERLSNLLRQTAPAGVSLEVEMEPIRVQPQRATAFSVIFNEFVTNSFKHAFQGRANGLVQVIGRQEGPDYKIVLSDNGTGTGENDNATTEGLGNRVIMSMARQLGATPRFGGTRDGYRFEIAIKDDSSAAALATAAE